MRAIVVSQTGGPEVLESTEMSEPIPAEGEVLVHVTVAGVNHFDLTQRSGAGGATAPFIPGVDAVGTRVDTGQPVLVSGQSGCYAEFVAAPETAIWALPEGIDELAALALGVPYRTAWAGIIDAGHLTVGDILLVQAGSSATGQACIDIGKAIGAQVFATASAAKLERLRSQGIEAFAYDDSQISELEANVVFDPVGGEALAHSVAALTRSGTVVIPGALGSPLAYFDVWTLVAKHAQIKGIGATDDRQTMTRLLNLTAQSRLKPVIDRELPLDQAAEAHRLIEARETLGKVVLRVR